MTLWRGSLLTVALLTVFGVSGRFSLLASADDAPQAEKKDSPDVQTPRSVPLPDGKGLRRGPQESPDADRFRPGRPAPNAAPGQTPRRDPTHPNPTDFEARTEGTRRPASPGAPAFGARMGHGRNDFEQLKETDPEMFELMQSDMRLDQQTREEAEEYRRAKPADKDAVKTRLAKLVEEHYEVRQKRRELELRRLEEQLTRLRESVKKRVEEKDVVIKQRISQLVGNPDDGF